MVEQLKSVRFELKDMVIIAVGVCQFALWAAVYFAGNTVDHQAIVQMRGDISDLRSQAVPPSDMTIVKSQISTLLALVSQLQSDLRAMPARAEFTNLDRHLSAQDGRMDGIDTRIRDLDIRSADFSARLKALEDASRVKLNGR